MHQLSASPAPQRRSTSAKPQRLNTFSNGAAAVTSGPVEKDYRSKLVELAFEADQYTDDRPRMQQLYRKCEGLQAALPPNSRAQAEARWQLQLIDSYMGGGMRNKKVLPNPHSDVARAYNDVAKRANSYFLFDCSASMHYWAMQSAYQRAVPNAAADACLLGTDGKIGGRRNGAPVEPELFYNASLTSTSEKLVTVQAQGPKGSEQIEKYLDALFNLAKTENCRHVLVINLSTDKIQSFGEAVHARNVEGITPHYFEVPWIDGVVPQTAEERRPLVHFAVQLASLILELDGRAVAAFNCHIGLDRSGLMNGLTQLLIDYCKSLLLQASEPSDHDTLSTCVQVLEKLKRARPHALSTSARFELLHACLKDLIDRILGRRFEFPF